MSRCNKNGPTTHGHPLHCSTSPVPVPLLSSCFERREREKVTSRKEKWSFSGKQRRDLFQDQAGDGEALVSPPCRRHR